MTTTTCVFGCVLSKNGQRLALTGPKNDAASEFFLTLPSGRWDGAINAWAADATPSAAWRVMNECPVSVEADDRVLALAALFADALEPTGAGQPATRKTDGWDHQLDAFHFANAKAGTLISHGMGCGKSWTAVNLIVNRDAKRTIILCPVSVLGVWRREFEKHAGRPVEVLILDKSTVTDKARRADAFLARCKIEGKPAVVVINYESAWREAFAKWALKQSWDVAVCDESHRIKGHDTAASKFAAQLAKVSAFRLALTGTPMPHSPLDLFGQYRFLDRGIFGTWFHHFRNRYAKLNPIFPGKVDAWINQDELKRRMALIAHRVTADEVLDLPEFAHNERRCKLSPVAQKIYDGLQDDLIADVGSGVVTATNALTRLLRLQQVTSGYTVEDETGREVVVDSEKETILAELLEDMGPDEPIVVFCRFRRDLVTVAGLAQRLGREYGELSGRWKHGLDDHGCMERGIQVMGVQIQSGGVGVDLTRARYAIYYSLGFSLGDYEQSLARVHRPGQTRPVHYYHIIASGTVDEAVYGALRARKEVVESVLEALKR